MRVASFLMSLAIGWLCSPALAASVEDWNKDVDQIVSDIGTTHPNAFTRVSSAKFLAAVVSLKALLPELSEEQRTAEVMKLVAMLGDGHTTVEPNNPQFAFWYPIRMYQFSDGYFVTSAHKSVADLAGAQVLRINNRPVEDAALAARSIMSADNDLQKMERLYPLSSAGLMKGLGFTEPDGTLAVHFRLANGRTIERRIAPQKTDFLERFAKDDSSFEWQFRTEVYGLPFGGYDDWISAFKGLPSTAFRTPDTARPLHFAYRRAFIGIPVPQHDAYYAQINVTGGRSVEETFAEFFRRIMREVDAQKPKRLILDWRYNFGGDGSKVIPMIHEFIKREDNPPWKELYLVTGRKSFSAAIMAIDAFLEHSHVTIVGEPAGAPINHYGDGKSFVYPRTGLRLAVSNKWHQLDAYDNGSFPYVDFPALMTFRDYAAGRDPAIDQILGDVDVRSISMIALADGGASARRALHERIAKFAKVVWWKPPSFQAIKRTGYQLLENHERPDDAAEMFRILTELYPSEWNGWESYGLALIAAGEKDEGLAAYKCALALDPENSKSGDMSKALAEAKTEVRMPKNCRAKS